MSYAAINAAEQELGKNNINVQLSLNYLLKCYEEEFNENICKGVAMTDLADFLSTRGLITEEDADRLGEKMCDDQTSIRYLFDIHRPEAPNRGGLMNVITDGHPTISLMSLNILPLRYASNMTVSDYPFKSTYNQPSVYGLITGYSEEGEDHWWMVDIAITPCEHQQIKLPMRDNDVTANFAGIAAYAFSIELHEILIGGMREL